MGDSGSHARPPLLPPLLALGGLIAITGVVPAGTALWDALFRDTVIERVFVGLANYREILTDQGFRLSLEITLCWAVLVTGVTTVAAVITAGLMHRSRRLRPVLYAALMLPWAVPIFILVPLWRILLHGVGGYSILSALLGIGIDLLNDPLPTFLTAAWVSSWVGLPAAVLIVYNGFSRLPQQTADSARLDGADRRRILLSLHVPMARHHILAVVILTFLRAMSEFTVIFLLTAGGPPLLRGITERGIIGATTTLEIYLFELFSGSVDTGPPAAAAVIVMTIVGVCIAGWFFLQGTVKGSPQVPSSRKIFGRTSQRRSMASQVRFSAAGTATVAVLEPLLVAVLVLSSGLLLYLVVWVSVSPLDSIYVNHLIPSAPTLRWFSEVVRQERIFTYFGNSLSVALSAALLLPVICFPAAYRLTWAEEHGERRRSRRILTAIQVMAFTGGIHALVPLYILFRYLRLIDTYVPIVLVAIAHTVPVALFATRAYLLGLPRSLEEQALLYGMPRHAYITRILLPLSGPVVLTTMIMAFLNAWNSFLVPLLFLNDDRRYTISVKIYDFVGTIGAANPRWGLFAAASLINMVIIGILFAIIRRRLGSTLLSQVDPE